MIARQIKAIDVHFNDFCVYFLCFFDPPFVFDLVTLSSEYCLFSENALSFVLS